MNSSEQNKLETLGEIITDSFGAQVIIVFADNGKRVLYKRFANFAQNSENFAKLCEIFGENNVKVVE